MVTSEKRERRQCRARVTGKAGAGQGALISTWHKVNPSWQKPEEQVAWMLQGGKENAQVPAGEPKNHSPGKCLPRFTRPARRTLSLGRCLPAAPLGSLAPAPRMPHPDSRLMHGAPSPQTW